MKPTPCEYMMWNGLPVIRKEIAESMINNFDLNQKEAAKKLGVTPAAVSQYFSKKRGKFKITDKDILEEIKISAERIILQENMIVIPETCRICRLLLSKGVFPFKCDSCSVEIIKLYKQENQEGISSWVDWKVPLTKNEKMQLLEKVRQLEKEILNEINPVLQKR
ncbi:putative transcriptional regulator [Thermoplasmatales archaeon SCGC AB-540-F20]|nr:putative transcriptional regulator [Thermoplasmatales archaeon SCGC AB-540-F20]